MSVNELITVESPNKCKKWTEYSGIKTIATAGHFMGLPKGEMGIDMSTYAHKFVVEKQNIFTNLKKSAKGKIVYIAEDEDREGAAIGYMTYQTVKSVAKAVYRIATNEITAPGIKKAIDSKVPYEEISKDYYYSFLGRRLSDRIIGYILSPMATRTINSGLRKEDKVPYSMGRVQSVGVMLIYEREMEIRDFKPEPFYSLSAFVSIKDLKVELKHTQDRFDDGDEVAGLVDKLDSLNAIVKSIKKGNLKSQNISPFTTSTFQQDVSSKLGIGAKRSMDIAQKLFEEGLITYHRTDQCKLSDGFNDSLRDYIASKYGADNLPPAIIKHSSKNSQADAHEGIRPTDLNFDSNSLSGDMKSVYDLIMSRTVASQMTSPVKKGTVVTFVIGDEEFVIKTQMIEKEGYLQVYKQASAKKELVLPELHEGDEFSVDELKKNNHMTKPPSRYTEASLVKKLESDGIGRPSTYATIVDTITKRDYGVLKGDKKTKVFHLEDKGETLINFAKNESLAAWVLDYSFTSYLETELDKVEHGKRNYKDVIREIHEKMDFKVPQERKKNLVDKYCALCGGQLEDAEYGFKCSNYSYDKSTGGSSGCQLFLYKDPIGLTLENLDDFLNGEVFSVTTQYGKADLCLDKKLFDFCKNGGKLKKGQSLITKKVDLLDDAECPKCKDGIKTTEKQYACQNVRLKKVGEKFKDIGTCDFKVNKNNSFVGYKLDDDSFRQLLNDGELLLENGKTITIDLENPYFVVDKNYNKKVKEISLTGDKCPVCKSDCVEENKVFKCTNKKKKNCKFIIYKENTWKNYTINLDRFKRIVAGEVVEVENDQSIELDLDNKKGFLKLS